MWVITSDLRNDKLDLLSTEGETVSIPYFNIDLKDFESSQEHEDPIGDLSEPDSLTLVFEGVEYKIAPYYELDDEVREIFLEWYSPS